MAGLTASGTLHCAPFPFQQLRGAVPSSVSEGSCSPADCWVCSSVRSTCAAEPSGAGLLDVLADAELLQQAGEAVCETIASTLLAAFSRHAHVRLRAHTRTSLRVAQLGGHWVGQSICSINLQSSCVLRSMKPGA